MSSIDRTTLAETDSEIRSNALVEEKPIASQSIGYGVD